MQLKQMNYVNHEFVKMNEVGDLVTQAVQGVIDKLKDKDKMLNAHKSLIRAIESKQKQMQQEIVTLMKVSRQMPDVHKQLRHL